MSTPNPKAEMMDYFINFLENWKKEKEEQGYFPSVDLLLEELNESDEKTVGSN
jgi:hypothetical protein